eukprot:m.340799 g.340799  ORF g.340799 m.340799 type:complete len:209 (-) comp19545_c0_seq1:118-744(-)
METLKDIFHKCKQEDINQAVASSGAAFASGFFIGGLISSKYTADAFIEANAKTQYVSQLEARRALNDAVIRDFCLRGTYWGLRLGAFVGIFGAMKLGLETHREKKDVFNIVSAGGMAGMISGAIKGVRSAAYGLVSASICSAVVGVGLQGLYWIENRARLEREKLDDIPKEIPEVTQHKELDPLEVALKKFEEAEKDLVDLRFAKYVD